MDYGILFTKLLTIATVLGNILTFFLLLAFLFARPFFRRIMFLLGTHGLWIATLLATGATLGSLVYSEVLGFRACILCWIQRGFMYPLMFLVGYAWWKKNPAYMLLTLSLAFLGGAVALYNWAEDMLGIYTNISLSCPVVPGLPSCDRILVLEYHYVTISMIALNAFILLGITMYAVLKKDKFIQASVD